LKFEGGGVSGEDTEGELPPDDEEPLLAQPGKSVALKVVKAVKRKNSRRSMVMKLMNYHPKTRWSKV
jgi:hypothetical protein